MAITASCQIQVGCDKLSWWDGLRLKSYKSLLYFTCNKNDEMKQTLVAPKIMFKKALSREKKMA